MDKKMNILFIQPVFYDPTLPNFKDRFELLSDKCCGHVVSISDGEYDGLRFGDFNYHQLPYIRNKVKKYTHYFITIMYIGIKAHRQKRLDYVHSCDPVFFGLSAVFIKFFTKAKLIIEINGHFNDPTFLSKDKLRDQIKRAILSLLIKFSLKNADTIKLLNDKQKTDWQSLLINKKAVIFHDFVPTHVFNLAKSKDENYVLFVGHPFYVKGVDVLIKAFLSIVDKFPKMRLKVIGHCHGGEKEREQYINMANRSSQIEILKPVFYDETIKIFQNCTFFVLPSRSEAMGRVLIEAMSCGKAVIGSNVGGIPNIIKDGENGFIFESGNVNDLAMKMELLLSDSARRKEMGIKSRTIVEQKFSSLKYAERFTEMITK